LKSEASVEGLGLVLMWVQGLGDALFWVQDVGVGI